jgi:hypothetical protein
MSRYSTHHDERCDITTTTEHIYRYDLDTDEIIESGTTFTDGGRTTDPVEARRIALDDADEREVYEATVTLDGCDMTVDEWWEEIDENCDGDEDEALNDKRELLRRKARAARDYRIFVDTFKPIPLDPANPHYFERDFDDKAWREADPRFVWTVIDTNGEGVWFSPGRRFVNRFAAVLCAVPWTDEAKDYAYD